MTTKSPTITYDQRSRILSLRLAGGKSVDSEVHGNVVMDYDDAGRLVRVDIMDCSLNEFRHAAPVHRYVRTRQSRTTPRHILSASHEARRGKNISRAMNRKEAIAYLRSI